MTISRLQIRGAWLAVLALLSMTQAAMAGALDAPHRDAVPAVRITATMPAAVTLRDAGKIAQVVTRAFAAEHRFDHGSGAPPLPSRADLSVTPTDAVAFVACAIKPAPLIWRACDLVSARAPPAAR